MKGSKAFLVKYVNNRERKCTTTYHPINAVGVLDLLCALESGACQPVDYSRCGATLIFFLLVCHLRVVDAEIHTTTTLFDVTPLGKLWITQQPLHLT